MLAGAQCVAKLIPADNKGALKLPYSAVDDELGEVL